MNFFSRKTASGTAPVPRYTRFLIAPDKFKGTLSADEVADIIAEELTRILPSAKLSCLPMADGGEGTAEIVGRAAGWKRRSLPVSNAIGRTVEASYFESPDGSECIVDSAAIVGFHCYAEPSGIKTPWQTTSFGIGEFIRKKIEEAPAQKILIGIGGTASIDAGAGLLQALGATFFDVRRRPLPPPPADSRIRASHLVSVFSADFSGIKQIAALRENILALADVDLPLVAEQPGAYSSLMFARQKGVENTEMVYLEEAYRNFMDVTASRGSRSHGSLHFNGAGGGIGYALANVLGCNATSGAQFVIGKLLPAPGSIPEEPTLLITGEGCLDRQSLTGKLVGSLHTAAAQHSGAHCNLDGSNNDATTLVVCGRCELPLSEIPHGMEVITNSAGTPMPSSHEEAETQLRAMLRRGLPSVLFRF